MIRASETSHQIGRVSAVESEQLTIELDPAASGLVKAGMSGVVPIGSINSYVTIPAGPQRVVGLVTGIRLAEGRAHVRGMGMEDVVIRELQAVMVGRFESGQYKTGISTYPSLFAPVSAATSRDIKEIFRPPHEPAISLGEAVIAPDQNVLLDVNALLSRHCAVVGSTGAGKSCTLTAILDGILGLDVPSASIVIFDSNGEYSRAFAPGSARGDAAHAFVIGPRPGADDGLFVPHWFMDSEDHVALLQPGEGAQAPLLQRAIADARLSQKEHASLGALLNVRTVLKDIQAIPDKQGRTPQKTLAKALEALARDLRALQVEAINSGNQNANVWDPMAGTADRWLELGLITDDRAAWDVPLELRQRNLLNELLSALQGGVNSELEKAGLTGRSAMDFDAPRFYSMEELHNVFLPNRIELESANEPRIRNYAATLLMRLARLLADRRYDFMAHVSPFQDALARYLRLLLGCDPLGPSDVASDPPWSDSYRRYQQAAVGKHAVTIVDLSMVASDVLENVTALLARLLLGFAQRVEPRGTFPILLVLEEAHRYIPAASGKAPSRSAVAFEKIAKEGRKFGVSLLVASQRPSELSGTVLAQCGTLIAHRILNPDDQELIRHATPYAGRDVLRQLPGLATQHAVVLGEAVPAPSYVRIRHVENPPESSDPDFIGLWRRAPSAGDAARIDSVARAWEGGDRLEPDVPKGEPEEPVTERDEAEAVLEGTRLNPVDPDDIPS